MRSVVAGDKVEMNVNNFYERYEAENDQPVNMEDMLGTLVSTLVGGQGGYTGTEGHETKTVTDALTLENYTQFNDILNNTTDPNQPKAYLNYILFDEAFNIVPQMSGSFQANGAGSWTQIGTTVPLEIPASGYLAVYLSNSSTNASVDEFGNVYFDQLVIRFSRGKLKEEAHYYPHGLPINGMGSVAVGMIENKDKYQANAYNKELGLNWVDFNNRQYDPQIGRFLSVDPLADQTHDFSPYAAMNNNPPSLTDPDGLRVGTELRKAGVQYGPPAPPWVAEWMDAEWIAILGKLNSDRFGDGGQSAAMWAEVLEAAAKQQADNTGADITTPNVDFSFMCNYADWSGYTDAVVDMQNSGQGVGGPQNQTVNGITVLEYVEQTECITHKGVQYDAGGLSIILRYDGEGYSEYQWIQTVTTNIPVPGYSSPYNDIPQDGNYPFYYTYDNQPFAKSLTSSSGYSPIFADRPSRRIFHVDVTWNAELTVMGRNSGIMWTPIATINYGFQITSGKLKINPIVPGEMSSFTKLSLYKYYNNQ